MLLYEAQAFSGTQPAPHRYVCLPAIPGLIYHAYPLMPYRLPAYPWAWSTQPAHRQSAFVEYWPGWSIS